MKYRTRKKVAKRYLDKGLIRWRYILKIDNYWIDSNWCCTEIILRSPKLRNAIYNEAYRRGWNGIHWDNPLRTYT